MNEDLWVGAFLVAWNGYLHFKQIEIKNKVKNLCGECVYTFQQKPKVV